MMRTAQRSLWTLAVAFACLGLVAGAATAAPRQVATLSGGAAVEFRPVVEYDKLVLTVSGPGEMSFRREFAQGQAATFSAFGKGGQTLPNGNYTYELLAVPRFSPEVRQRLAAARRQGNERAVLAELRQAGLLPKGTVQSGGFVMENGTFIVAGLAEESGPKAAKEAVRAVTAADQVIPDDLIVQGSECVGLDCVNNENFGFDTIRLKENNLRIHFDDTSTQAGFPANDWRIIANDSASGGSSKFSIEDSTSAKTPFTITAGAATNSIFADSTGRIGLRTSTPVLDLHINTSNTPAIRLEQNNSGGFTAQTWDIGANEANFFVRDVTGGSRLSFRIRPGAPTSSIDISADGDVGIGTASPGAKLHVVSGETRLDSVDATDTHFNFSGNNQNYLRGTTIIADNPGTARVGIGCDSPGFDLVVGGTSSNCATAPFSHINAGDANWVGSSSRTVKQNIVPIEVPNILDKIEAVDVFTYDFINGSTNRMGLMAEDFHQVFGRGSDTMLDSGEVQMALWLAVQQLTAQNQGLTERLAALEAQLAAEKSGQPKN